MSALDLSIVVPMCNEEESLGRFFEAVVPIVRNVSEAYEIICVNDGSSDRTLELLIEARQANAAIKIVDLSRRFGKEAALRAGVDHATGSAVVPMDADLQDPPDLLPELVAKWREGYNMVVGVRTDRSSDSVAKRLTASWFYRIIGRVGGMSYQMNAGDYRLMDRKVVDTLGRFPERLRFTRGMVASFGFRQAAVPYARPKRLAGKSKFRAWRMWNFAIEGIVSFTTWPLRVWSYLGLILALLALAYTVILIVRTLVYGIDVPGYASLLSVSLFFNGVVLISLGILGEYVSRIFIEVKQRPPYLVAQTYGLDDLTVTSTG